MIIYALCAGISEDIFVFASTEHSLFQTFVAAYLQVAYKQVNNCKISFSFLRMYAW